MAIATPVSSHFELAAAALRAGKHVFVEKPLAASAAEGEQLQELADELGLLLMPGHTFLYSPPVVMIRDLIQSGELGDIYFVSTSRVNLGLHQSDVSVIWDLGPHDFSILCYWLGETPHSISAMSRGCIMPGTPDVMFVNLEYPSKTIAHVELSWLAPSKLRRTTVVGSRKMIVYDDTSNEPVRVFDSGVVPPDPESFGEYRLTYRSGEIVSPPIAAAEPLGLELDDFCSAIRNGEHPRSSAALGIDVVRMIEAVDRSLELDGAEGAAAGARSRRRHPGAAPGRLPRALVLRLSRDGAVVLRARRRRRPERPQRPSRLFAPRLVVRQHLANQRPSEGARCAVCRQHGETAEPAARVAL